MIDRVKLRTDIHYWIREVRRLWVPILLTALGAYWLEQWTDAYPAANWLRLAYKANSVAIGIILAHMTWSQLFYYLDFGSLLKSKNSTKIAGLAIMRGLYYLAVILAFTMGL
jgi:hypothetical protein